MSDLSGPPESPSTRWDYRVFWLSAVVAALAAGVLGWIDPAVFQRFLGQTPPIVVVTMAAIVGVVSLRLLESRRWWSPRPERDIRRGVLLSTAAALVFAGIVIGVDLWLGFPEDLNVLWPASLLYYPAVAL
ncbi:MAG TPA: hypothetical protein VF148_13515 [Acidimicrobiia bacterium]